MKKIRLSLVPRATPNADSVPHDFDVSDEDFEALMATRIFTRQAEFCKKLVPADQFVVRIIPAPV